MVRLTLTAASLALTSVLGGCALPSGRQPLPVPITIRENFERRYFELEVRNDTPRPLCLNYTDWPRRDGEIPFPAGKVYLEENGQTFPMVVQLMINPPVNMFVSIAPGSQIVGYVPFSLFDDPGLDRPNPSRRLIVKNYPILPCR